MYDSIDFAIQKILEVFLKSPHFEEVCRGCV
jgi:hypothetical protein